MRFAILKKSKNLIDLFDRPELNAQIVVSKPSIHMNKDRRHNVYVVELDKEILSQKKFLKKHPEAEYLAEDKCCLYVGMTGLTPDERFEKHKEGHKCCTFVRDHGLWLRRKMYEKFNPMNHEEAAAKEVSLAEELRAKGHVVHQN
jgi:hypothetical protein